MELKTFIKDVIFQLADGLTDVISEQDEHKIVVNPSIVVGSLSCGRYVPNNVESYKNMGKPVQFLELDMSVHVSEDSKVEVSGGFNISFASAKGNTENSASEVTGNRMSISIPLCLPTTEI